MLGTSCSTIRSNLGTTSSPCYVALPVAAAAVHHHGHLIGVLPADPTLLEHDPALSDVVSGNRPHSGLCLVAYSGRFARSDVADGRGRAHGRVAVVVVRQSDRELLGTVIVRHSHERFGHPLLGIG